MPRHRLLTEFGLGTSLRRRDYTQAADRAIEDALRHLSLPLFETLDIPHDQMRVQVTIEVRSPDALDLETLTKCLTHGHANVTKGGHNVDTPLTGTTIVIATAAVEACPPNQSDHRTRP